MNNPEQKLNQFGHPEEPEPSYDLAPITPTGDTSIIGNLEKFLPNCDGEAERLVEAELEAYKKRRDKER